MKTCGKLIFSIVLAGLCGCDISSDSNGIMVFSYSFDFSEAQNNWHVDFTDFPAGVDSSSYELKFAYTDRPPNLGANKKSIMVSGNNHSDLFMFMKRKITDLSPNTDYSLVFEVELASNAMEGIAGAGGSPGGGVFLKAGASTTEPKRIIEDNQYALNVDKGNQDKSGEMAIVLGDIAVPYGTQGYTLITRNSAVNAAPFMVRSNSSGEVWLIIGTESGFAGTTTVYYTRVNVVFSTTSN